MSSLIFLNTYSALISGLLMVGLGFFVFLKKPKERVNFVFLCFCLAMSCWLLSSFKMYSGDSAAEYIFWDRIVYCGVVFIPVLMYHFGLVFTNTEDKNRIRLYLGYFAAFIFLILTRTDGFVYGLYEYSWGVHTRAGIYHDFFLVFYSIYVCVFLVEIYKFLKKTGINELERKRAQYLFVSFVILNLGAYAFLPAYHIDLNPLAAYWLEFVTVVIVSFTILKYNLFGVRVLLTEILVFAIGLILFMFPFLLPEGVSKIFAIAAFLLFCVFAYYLIKAIHGENRRREQAELVAAHERVLREQAEELANNLKRLDAAKTQFLLSTQHHLRGPLTVIQGYLSMISEGNYGKIPIKANKKIAVSLESTRKLIHLVNDLLDVARFQMDKGMVAKEPTDMVKIMGEIISDLEEAAQAKKIYLRFMLPIEAIPLIIVDPRGIREALYNVVDNAIKYTQKGGVMVSVVVAGKRLRVSVADTGIGMNEKDRQGLFMRTFERGERARSVNVNGKGIGLYLAAQMIVSNGGTIRAESAGWNKGTEFIIGLPMHTVPIPAVPPRLVSGTVVPVGAGAAKSRDKIMKPGNPLV
jgi:signal transduction histidine kinase